jgi:HD-like signal output (HDOD) protein
MKIKCQGCDKEYNIPEERLPYGKKIAFPCPACKKIIEIDLRNKAAGDESSSSQSAEQPEKASAPPTELDTNLLSGDPLKNRILRRLKELPPMPQVMFKAREVMNNPGAGFKELAGILETDQSMAARVLRLSNSAYYGMAGKVTSLQHASALMGYKTLGEVVSMAGSSSLLGKTLEGYKLDSGDLWNHSLAVALSSRIIALKKAPDLDNDAFSAGLIHDAGKLVLDQYVLERTDQFGEFMAGGHQTFLDAEKHILGFDHPEIAYEMCLAWKIPGSLINAIRYHHYPSRSSENKLAHIVHIADSLAMMSGIGTGIDGMLYRMDEKSLEFIGLREEELTDIMEQTIEGVQKIVESMPKI